MFKKSILLASLIIFVFGLCPFVYGEEAPASTPTPQPPASQATPQKKLLDPVCMQNAVEKRDNAIIAGVDAFAAFVKGALEIRRDAQKTAWTITDKKQRQIALKNAWAKFKGTWAKGLKKLRADRSAAWKKFYIDRKACGSNAPLDDKTTESADSF